MSVFNLHQGVVAGTAAAGGGAVFDTTLIGNSIWLEGAGTSGDAMTRTWGSQSNQDRWIWATWFQPLRFADEVATRSNIFATGSGSHGFYLRYNSTASTLNIFHRDNAGNEGAINTTESYRDLTAWIHVLVDYDSANLNSQDRISLYVNGVRTGVSSGTAPAQNNDLQVNVQNQTAIIGHDTATTPNYYTKGYLAQTIFLDNKSIANGDLAISDFLDTFTFGTNGSQFIPKADADIIALASAAGTNSFCLDYSDASNITNDASTKTNHFTAVSSSITATNQSSHTPSLSYPVLNALDPTTATAINGSLDFAGPSADDKAAMRTSIGIPDDSGKYYWEYLLTGGSNDALIIGIAGDGSVNDGYDDWMSDITPSIGVYTENGSNKLYVDGSQTSTSVFSTGAPVSGTTIGVAYDSATRKIWFASNNVYANTGNPAAGSGETGTLSSSGTAFPTVSARGSSDTLTLRFDSGDFVYSAPDGFKELNTGNLTAPTYQGIDYFDATIYEGNGAGQRVGDFVPYTDLYTVNNSIIFDPGTKNHLQRTMSAAASDSNKKFTLSAWAKRVSISDTYAFSLLESTDSGGGNAAAIRIYSTSSGTGNMYFQLFAQGSGVSGGNVNVTTVGSAVQTSSWQHFFIQVDTTQPTASDRIKLYIDGVLQEVDNSGGSAAVYPDQDAEFYLGDNDFATQIGKIPYGAYYSSMYIAEHAFLTGTNSTGKTISDFAAVDTATNKWVPKDISGFTFGHNGHYLEFKVTPGSSNGSGTDTSGNDSHFEEAINDSASAWSSYTSYQTVDAPSKNFAVLDPGTLKVSTGTLPIAEGNLKVGPKAGGGGGAYRTGTGFSIPEGSWIYKTTMPGKDSNLIGVWTESGIATLDGGGSTKQTGFYGINVNNGELSHNKTETSASDAASIHGYSWGSDIPSTQAMNVLINRTGSTYKLWFIKDGATAAAGNPATGTGAHIEFSSTEAVYAGIMTTSTQHSLTFDFGASNNGSFTGNSNFSDYKLINQDNLDATSDKITAWAWIKNRDAGDSHILVDRVRGVGQTLNADDFSIETSEPDTVQRFLQRGVQIANDVQVNTSGESYVLWQWLAGKSAGTGSVTSPAGGISSNTIISTPGNFSVGTYTGTGSANTVGHGLGGAPELILIKNRSSGSTGTSDWVAGVARSDVADPWTDYGHLDTSGSFGDLNTKWNDTAPTATVFTIGTHNRVNKASDNYVFYAFRSVPGVCKIGTYEGNGASGDPHADGTYISMGFKPRWVMVKIVDSGVGSDGNWTIYDTTRQPFNSISSSPTLFADDPNPTSGPERSNSHNIDILSDGVKFRDNSNQTNSARTYIYLAMAEIAGNGTLPPIYGR